MARMTLAEAKERISADLLREYEAVRKSGKCNMLILAAVQDTAAELGFVELAGIDREDYVAIVAYHMELITYHFGGYIGNML